MEGNYNALAGGVSAWGLGRMGARGGFGSGGALGTPQAPSGFIWLTGSDGQFIYGADGQQLYGRAP